MCNELQDHQDGSVASRYHHFAYYYTAAVHLLCFRFNRYDPNVLPYYYYYYYLYTRSVLPSSLLE